MKTKPSVAAVLLVTAMAFTHGAYASDIPRAFAANSADEVVRALGATQATANPALALNVPKIAESGASVGIDVTSRISGTEWIAIIADKNPTPLAALVRLQDQQPTIQARIKLVEDSPVRAIVKAGGRYYVTQDFVKVTEGGCGGGSPSSVRVEQSPRAVGVTRIKSRPERERVLVQLLIQHPMETGLRQHNGKMTPAVDAKSGKPIGPHYIQRLRARLNDSAVLEAYWGPSIAASPYFAFGLSQYKKGDQVSVEWEDNQGTRGGNKAVLG